MTTETAAEAGPPDGRDMVLLALAARLKGFEGTQLAPIFAPDVLMAALDCYLELGDDETLLAIVRDGKNDPPASGCALTTRRVHWPGKPAAAGDEPGLLDDDRRDRGTGGFRPRLHRSLSYRDLPATIDLSGGYVKSIDLGPGCRIGLGYHDRAQVALIHFLRDARSTALGELPPPEVPPEVLARAGHDWPAVVDADAAAKGDQTRRRSIRTRIQLASRAVVTPVLVAACVAVYLAMMVVVGGAGGTPSNEAMVSWGAVFGPSIVLDGEPWRLLTAMFLHFGPMHLAMNMWCLVGNGPMVERFFGHWAFAAIYVLSGIGASVASLWAHPTSVCAGASGAIFGVLGAIFGFVLAQRRHIPAAMLRPLHSGAGAFLIYNLVISLGDPHIDKAAHLGGLATGFVAGFLLTPAPADAGRPRSARRPALAAAIAVGLGLLARYELGHARAQIEADPEVGRVILANSAALSAWNDFAKALAPVIAEFEAVEDELVRVAKEIDGGDTPGRRSARALDDLSARSNALGPLVVALPAADAEIRAMRDRLHAGRDDFGASVEDLKRFVATRDPATVKAFNDANGRYKKDFQDFVALRTAYFQAHGFTLKPD